MKDNQVSPKARETEQILAREGRATRLMIAAELEVSGTRATQLLKELIRDGRARRVSRGLYEHEYYTHDSIEDLEGLRKVREANDDFFAAILHESIEECNLGDNAHEEAMQNAIDRLTNDGESGGEDE